MQQIAPVPRDPAPSKTAYRFQRLWLTPLFRTLLRTGVPVASLALGAYVYLSDETRLDALRAQVQEVRASIEQRPEFMVNLMRIDNVAAEVADDIREVTAVDFPISSFDLDLASMRTAIEDLDAVARAELLIRAGGILDVIVTERVPAIVWRGRETLELLDVTGHRVAPVAARMERADLPLIAGDGADKQVPEALEIFAGAAPVADRVRGLLRVGDRRWDLILDRNQRIMLPELDPVPALERALALNEINDLLMRDLQVVDLRDARRPTLRLSQDAMDFLIHITDTSAEDTKP